MRRAVLGVILASVPGVLAQAAPPARSTSR
jgi:hypothetical protein